MEAATPDDNDDSSRRLVPDAEAASAAAASPPDTQQPVAALLRAVSSVTVAGAPLHAWAQLCVAVAAVSTAASAFLLARDVPPALLAGWRLTLVTLLLVPPAWVQWRAGDAALRCRWTNDVHLMVAAGAALGGHFGFFVVSTQTTALTHALLLVSATPLLLAAWAGLRRQPLSRGEVVGTLASVAGGALLVCDARSDASVSLWGDVCAFVAAAFFGVYLSVGQECRAWCPLFLYAVVVNAAAASTLLFCAVLLEGASVFGAGRHGVFGWLTAGRYAGVTTYLAVCPGIIGHTSFNAVLKHISPLVITVALTTEPLFGSLLGAAMGVASPPHRWAYVGGIILMGSTLLVVYSEARRKTKQAALGTG